MDEARQIITTALEDLTEALGFDVRVLTVAGGGNGEAAVRVEGATPGEFEVFDAKLPVHALDQS